MAVPNTPWKKSTISELVALEEEERKKRGQFTGTNSRLISNSSDPDKLPYRGIEGLARSPTQPFPAYKKFLFLQTSDLYAI